MHTSYNPLDISIIVVDDDKDIRENTVDLLSTQYKKIKYFDSPTTALKHIYENIPAIILTDLRMPDGDGLEFTQNILQIDPNLPVILMTGYGDISIAVDAMKQGVYDFIEKPIDADYLLRSISRAIEKRRLSLSLKQTQESLDQHHSIESRLMGNSPMMKQLKQSILQLAPMDIPVMIHGETGVGKELVAKCVHDFSQNHSGHFVALNCAAIPEHLAEAELFGYEKGAFTDAKSKHIGKLEYADKGTLFLDEIESLTPAIQAKLLRVLQDGVITPLGSNQQITTQCRIVSATKENLRLNEHFRQDLFFRLQVGELNIPALRQRKDDIVMLFDYFVRQNCDNLNINYQAASKATIQLLLEYDWLGNVRELINVSTRYAINGCKDLRSIIANTAVSPEIESEQVSLKEQVNAFEESLIRAKLAEYNGHVASVLKALKIERRTFNQKLTRYHIETAQYKK